MHSLNCSLPVNVACLQCHNMHRQQRVIVALRTPFHCRPAMEVVSNVICFQCAAAASMSRKLMPARSFTRLDISDADDDVTARAASTAIYEQQKFLAAASSFHSGLAHSGSGNSGSPSPSESTPKSGSSLTAGTPAATVATPFLASGATASAAGPHPLMGDIFDKGVMGSKTKQLPPLQTGNLVKHKPELISPGPPEDKADNQPGIFRKLTWTGR